MYLAGRTPEAIRPLGKELITTRANSSCCARSAATGPAASPSAPTRAGTACCASCSRSLLAGKSGLWYVGEEAHPYLGWYGLDWEGTVVEVAPTPDCGSGEAICFADAEAPLVDFVRALADYAIRPRGRCLRYSEGWEDAPDMGRETGQVTWEDIVLPPDTLAAVREALEGFFAHREAFAAFGFAWKRGVLLIGPPGRERISVKSPGPF